MRIAKSKGYGLNPIGKTRIFITPLPNQIGKIGKSMIPQLNQ